MSTPTVYYCPAIPSGYFESPIDALRHLCVPADEAMCLVQATWQATWQTTRKNQQANNIAQVEEEFVFSTLSGGQRVLALRLSAHQWAACRVYLEPRCTSKEAALRECTKWASHKHPVYVCAIPALYF